jgi:hypothetical protein
MYDEIMRHETTPAVVAVYPPAGPPVGGRFEAGRRVSASWSASRQIEAPVADYQVRKKNGFFISEKPILPCKIHLSPILALHRIL